MEYPVIFNSELCCFNVLDMKIDRLRNFLLIGSFLFVLSGCSNEDTIYSDDFGNVIKPETPQHPITGKRYFECKRYFSTGSLWETYEFETTISPTHLGNLFVISQIKLDNSSLSGRKIETNSSFVMDEAGNLSANDLTSKNGNTYSFSGKYDSVTNKISMRITDIESRGFYLYEEK